ncbi:butyrophilin subfamily 3 member A2-like [Genypterus blacodes]|uniref:butyrophilin subfamily 3 member A2-like n=1 Tax=Genypterus blacodes TaxID=154954 RepID=UPI003F76DA23
MRFPFTLLWLVYIGRADGHPVVTGSPEPVVAALGDDVILPCHLEPAFNAEDTTVEWRRNDLQREYVHLYRHGREFPDMKLASYNGRTFLSADGLRRGDISLKIINVTLADEGVYRCKVPKLVGSSKMADIQLVVEPNLTKTWTMTTTLPSLQTQEPKVKGGRSRQVWIVPVVFASCVVLIATVMTVIVKRQNLTKSQKSPRIL